MTRQLYKTPAERNRLILVGIAILGVLWLLNEAGDALGPFVIALVLAYLLSPLVDRLARLMPRLAAILSVYIAVIGGLVLAGFLVIPGVVGQVQDLLDQAPQYFQQFQASTRDWQAQYEALKLPQEARTTLENSVRQALASAGGALQATLFGTLRTVRQVFGVLAGFVVIPFFLFYVLKDSNRGLAWMQGLLPRHWQPDARRLARIGNDILNDYIRGQLILGLVVGIATTAGLFLVGSRYWLLLGIIAGFTELIPILGPIVGAVPGLTVAAFHPEGLGMVVKVLLVYLVVQQLENNLLVPKIQGDSVKLHPAVILLVLVVGGQVAGLVGLIVAVPVAAIVRDWYIYLYRRLVDTDTPAVAEDQVPSRQDEHAQGTEATA
jgi:predicted PurR-regulated permease PerM